MSLYRYPGSTVWTMDFVFHGQRVRESTGTRSKTLAKKIMDKRRRDLEESTGGISRRQKPKLFSVAAAEWLKNKESSFAPKTIVIETTNLSHLKPEFGRSLTCDIGAHDLEQYKRKRLLQDAASPKTINLEIGTLRAVVGKRVWFEIRAEAHDAGFAVMLKASTEVGRAISTDEERALLAACSKSRSRSLLPFVVLALETGSRYGTIRTLQWCRINFTERCLQFGKDKTPKGTNRKVPLNPRALETLRFWANQFPERKPEHYVFPAEKYGAAGNKFEPKSYDTDPTQPIARIKEAWEAAKVRAAKILSGIPQSATPESGIKPLDCRFHDLRHTAVSRMLDAGVPLLKIAEIVGWSEGTMVRMAKRYGHFGLEELRSSVETITRREIHSEYPVFSPVSTSNGGKGMAN